jgi:hypothetical protein
MNTGQKAEKIIKNYFYNKGIVLIRAPKGELGYDFKKSDDKFFIEVKGTTAKELSKVPFRYFTNTEYEKARACRKSKVKYEIHLITGIQSNDDIGFSEHYMIPGNDLLDKGKPEVTWMLPIRKKDKDYLLKD